MQGRLGARRHLIEPRCPGASRPPRTPRPHRQRSPSPSVAVGALSPSNAASGIAVSRRWSRRTDLPIGVLTRGVRLTFATWPPRCRGTGLGEGRVPLDRSINENPICSSRRRTRCRYPDRRTRTSRRGRAFQMPWTRSRTQNVGNGSKQPSENTVSTCSTLSRMPLVGGVAGWVSASRVLGVMPRSEPPVAAHP